MADHNITGNIGEELAEKYLRSLGYEILEKNWRYGKTRLTSLQGMIVSL